MGGDGYYGDDHIDGIPDVIVIGESPDSLSNALEDGPVLGIMNPGDVDGNGISDDGHAVIITDFDAEMVQFTIGIQKLETWIMVVLVTFWEVGA